MQKFRTEKVHQELNFEIKSYTVCCETGFAFGGPSPHSIPYHHNKQMQNFNKISTSSTVSKRAIFQIYNRNKILNLLFSIFMFSLTRSEQMRKLKLESTEYKNNISISLPQLWNSFFVRIGKKKFFCQKKNCCKLKQTRTQVESRCTSNFTQKK